MTNTQTSYAKNQYKNPAYNKNKPTTDLSNETQVTVCNYKTDEPIAIVSVLKTSTEGKLPVLVCGKSHTAYTDQRYFADGAIVNYDVKDGWGDGTYIRMVKNTDVEHIAWNKAQMKKVEKAYQILSTNRVLYDRSNPVHANIDQILSMLEGLGK